MSTISRTRFDCCSTPEGVIVKFTKVLAYANLDDRICSTPEGVIVKFTRARLNFPAKGVAAQRPKASSSSSRRDLAGTAAKGICSTPEGVIVKFTGGPGG